MFARTKRLTLRPGWPEDAPALTHAIAHEQVAVMLSRLPWPYTEQHAVDWLSTPRASDEVSLNVFAHDFAADETAPRLIGGVGLHPVHDDDSGEVEIGYWLTPEAWGRGYATEAGRAMLGMARYAVGIRRLVGRHALDNPASGNVLRKLGFRPTGQGRMFSVARDRDVDCATLALDFDEDEPACRVSIAA